MVKVILTGKTFTFEQIVKETEVKTLVKQLVENGLIGSFDFEVVSAVK
jgi:hypothetical protein